MKNLVVEVVRVAMVTEIEPEDIEAFPEQACAVGQHII